MRNHRYGLKTTQAPHFNRQRRVAPPPAERRRTENVTTVLPANIKGLCDAVDALNVAHKSLRSNQTTQRHTGVNSKRDSQSSLAEALKTGHLCAADSV